MDPLELVARVRDHYIEQFTTFICGHREACIGCASEVKPELSEECTLFRRIYCVDFITSQKGVVELAPDRSPRFEPMQGAIGETKFSIEQIVWNDVWFAHDLEAISGPGLDNGFDRCFDPNENRHEPGAELSPKRRRQSFSRLRNRRAGGFLGDADFGRG